MNEKTAESLLSCYRRGRPNEPQVEKAARLAESRDVLRQALETQTAFDARVGDAVRAIAPPEDLSARLAAHHGEPAAAGAKPPRPPFAIPAICAVAIGGIVIVGWLAYLRMEENQRFPGREAVEQVIRGTNRMSEFDLEPVSHAAGQLGDWFYMRGFEDYAVPEEIAALPAIGSRVFHQDGKAIAQVAIGEPEAVVSVFRASDFGVQLPADGEWQVIDQEGGAAAVRRRGDTCVLVTSHGGEPAIRALLRRGKSERP